ncbi:MAG: helix-turn-helix domain-containing protein [Candidatus Nanopusillus sp.]|nr:helix-turn-helix domain-containing protein [Candidatus Nanopusillus sp.]
MKVVQIGQTKYEIRSKDDLVSISHELARKGYSIAEIARILGVTERTVKKYMSDCW